MTRSRSFDRDGTCSQREVPSKRSEIGKRSAESRIANPNPRKASAEEDEEEKDRGKKIKSNQIPSLEKEDLSNSCWPIEDRKVARSWPVMIDGDDEMVEREKDRDQRSRVLEGEKGC